MDAIKVNRDNIKLLASGKYLALRKSYDQQEHDMFIEGALFAYDLKTMNKEVSSEAESKYTRSTQEKN